MKIDRRKLPCFKKGRITVLSNRITQKRLELNMTLKELAYKANMSLFVIWKIETCFTKHPRIKTIKKIAKGLGVKEEFLFRERD